MQYKLLFKITRLNSLKNLYTTLYKTMLLFGPQLHRYVSNFYLFTSTNKLSTKQNYTVSYRAIWKLIFVHQIPEMPAPQPTWISMLDCLLPTPTLPGAWLSNYLHFRLPATSSKSESSVSPALATTVETGRVLVCRFIRVDFVLLRRDGSSRVGGAAGAPLPAFLR